MPLEQSVYLFAFALTLLVGLRTGIGAAIAFFCAGAKAHSMRSKATTAARRYATRHRYFGAKRGDGAEFMAL